MSQLEERRAQGDRFKLSDSQIERARRLRYEEGLSTRAIATRLGVRIETVRKRIKLFEGAQEKS